MDSNYIQIHSNFDRSKKDLLEFKTFEIKYGYEGFQKINNVLHRNVLIFEIEFELKIWEVEV
jgi:hypothetical protein